MDKLEEIQELKRKNKILLERIHNCKRKNREDKQRLLSTIRFLTGDKEQYLKINSVSDILWSADNVMASILAEIIIRFKKTNFSIPSEIYEECNHNEELARKKWDEILDAIIYAFRLATHNSEIKTEKEQQSQKKGLQLFATYFNSLWI